MKPLISIEDVKTFYDGTITRPQLKHPECVVFDKQGNLWCGGDSGEIYRLKRNSTTLEKIATTNGFILGLAFDSKDNLYICDLRHAKVFRLNTNTGELIDFAICKGNMSIKTPNYPIVDKKRNVLYVSESNEMGVPGPGIWRFNLSTGIGEMWCNHIFNFANGLAMDKNGSTIYIAETFGKKISKLTIHPDGSPGEVETVVNLEAIPDGVVLDKANNFIYICCYEPSMVYRMKLDDPQGNLQLLVHDPYATTLCHPTNGAINENKLFLANLGRWHISEIDLSRK